MKDKKIWALVPKEKRKEAIINLLQNKKEIGLAELIRNHHNEIGVAIGEDGKVYHQTWEIVRNDCKSLAKEGKIILEKGKLGRIKIYLAVGEKASTEEKIKKEIHQGIDELARRDMIIDSINALKNKISKIRGEITEIWKLLSKALPKDIPEKRSIESLISALEELIRNYKG